MPILSFGWDSRWLQQLFAAVWCLMEDLVFTASPATYHFSLCRNKLSVSKIWSYGPMGKPCKASRTLVFVWYQRAAQHSSRKLAEYSATDLCRWECWGSECPCFKFFQVVILQRSFETKGILRVSLLWLFHCYLGLLEGSGRSTVCAGLTIKRHF